ncbi:MAG: OmpA family protein, partial [Pseudomonadota bacterium]
MPLSHRPAPLYSMSRQAPLGRALLAALLAGTASPSLAELAPPAGLVSTAERREEADTLALPLPDQASAAIAGRLSIRAFEGDAVAEMTPQAVLGAYRARLEAAGYDTVLHCLNRACGGVARLFDLTLLPAPDMLVDTADMGILSAVATLSQTVEPDSETDPASADHAVTILASRVLGNLHVQIAEVTPASGAGAPPIPADTPTPESETNLNPEPAAPAAEPQGESVPTAALTIDPAALQSQLEGQGHVVLPGIAFETGTASLTDSSSATMDMVADLLSAAPDLAVAVVGHSDNQGTLAVNITVSEARAESVRDAL